MIGNATPDLELMTPKELARTLRCSLAFAYKLADSGVLSCIRLPCNGSEGKRHKTLVRFLRSDVIEFVRSHRR